MARRTALWTVEDRPYRPGGRVSATHGTRCELVAALVGTRITASTSSTVTIVVVTASSVVSSDRFWANERDLVEAFTCRDACRSVASTS